MADRENLLRLTLDLAAVAEALEVASATRPDLAFADERVEALRGLVAELDSGTCESCP